MCTVLELGLIEYQEAYHLQRTLHQQRVEGKISDVSAPIGASTYHHHW